MAAPARAAVAALAADHGAHIVLADSGKRPCWLDRGPYSWPRRRPSPEVIEAHPGRFGIVPWSIKTTGLDVDHGDPLQLSIFCEPIANLRTRHGHHLYCADDQGRPHGHFDLQGSSGDIRGNRGYLLFHYDGAVRLLDALRRRDDWQPRDLFELVGLPTVRAPRERTTKAPRRAMPAVTLTLAEASPGCRWNVLLRYLGDVARVTNRPRRWPGGPVDVDAWNATILELAREALERMPRPRLPMREVRRLAYLIGTWSASGGRRDHSPETQRWRGRRSSGGGRPRLYEPGVEPWTVAGVSRSTWYRHRETKQPVRACVSSGASGGGR